MAEFGYARSGDAGSGADGGGTAGRQVLRVEEFLPYPRDAVWRALTAPDLMARWLETDDFRDFPLAAGHRLAITSDPVRRVGLGGTGQLEVVAVEAEEILRIAWADAGEGPRRLDSTVTFTLVTEGTGTRLLVEHEGFHPPGIAIGQAVLTTSGCHTSTRHVGEVAETTSAWQAFARRLSDVLAAASSSG